LLRCHGQGIAALEAVNLLTAIEARKASAATGDALQGWCQPGPGTAASLDHVHALVEAMRLSFADARHFVGDEDFNRAGGAAGGEPSKPTRPASELLLSAAYAEERSKAFQPGAALVGVDRGCPEASSCTVSFQVKAPRVNSLLRAAGGSQSN